MTTNTHTPGPWCCLYGSSEHIAIEAPAVLKGVAIISNRGKPEAEQWANAQLIAAAPDLLTMMKAIKERAKPAGGKAVMDYEQATVTLSRVEWTALLDLIAKAEGASAKPPAIGPAVKDVERMCEALTWMGVTTSESLEECCFRYDELARHLVSAVLRNKRRATTEPKAEPLAEYISFEEGDALHTGEQHPQSAPEMADAEPLGPFYGDAKPETIDRRTAAVTVAYLAEYISEGEAARTLGIGRIEFRELSDTLQDEGAAAWEAYRNEHTQPERKAIEAAVKEGRAVEFRYHTDRHGNLSNWAPYTGGLPLIEHHEYRLCTPNT